MYTNVIINLTAAAAGLSLSTTAHSVTESESVAGFVVVVVMFVSVPRLAPHALSPPQPVTESITIYASNLSNAATRTSRRAGGTRAERACVCVSRVSGSLTSL